MYKKLIQDKFPGDSRLGLYVSPNLPAVKLGKILMKHTRISQPGDVVALHLDEGLFGSTAVVLTDTECFYDGGSFPLEELKGIQLDGKTIIAIVNHLGDTTEHRFEVGNEETAQIFLKLFDDIVYFDPEAASRPEAEYPGFEGPELDWLRLRDEVMRTIDMLQEKFNDGKLSLLQYEDKKDELLKRL